MKTAATLLLVSVALLHADDITLTDGTVFKNAKIVAHNEKSATLTFDDGVAMVKLDKLPASALLKIVTDKQPVTPDGVMPPAITNADAAMPPAPVEIVPGIRQATDDVAMMTEGRIVKVNPKGVLVTLNAVATHTVEVPHHDEHTIDVVPTGLGHTPVNQVVSKDWVSTETKVDKTNLGTCFVNCPVEGLIDGQPWSGKVWRIGTYSYADKDDQHTVAKYTAVPQEAYVYFSAHPNKIADQSPQPSSDPMGNTIVIPDETPLGSDTTLSVDPMK